MSVIEALLRESETVKGVNSIFDRFVGLHNPASEIGVDAEFGARWFVEKMALALQAATLIRGGNQRIADLFCSVRLTENLGLAFGTLRSGDVVALLLDRSRPRRNDK